MLIGEAHYTDVKPPYFMCSIQRYEISVEIAIRSTDFLDDSAKIILACYRNNLNGWYVKVNKTDSFSTNLIINV